jgi:positive regulator of sigma E activity
MGFLLLGIDSLIACLAIGALVDRRWRLPLAALFGFADGAAFLIGAGLGWTLSAGLTEILEIGTLGALGLYLLVVAAGSRRLAELSVWVVPFALTMDNLAYGVANDYSGSLAGQATQQAVSSSLLALVGLLVVAAVLPRVEEHRTAATRVAGGALLLVAGAFVLAG